MLINRGFESPYLFLSPMKPKLTFLLIAFLLVFITVIVSYIFLPKLWFNRQVTARNITFYFDSPDKCLDMPDETIKTQIIQATDYFYKNCLYADSSIKHQIIFYKNPLIRQLVLFYASKHNLGFCLTKFNRLILIYKVDFCTDGVPMHIPYSENNLYLYRRNKVIIHELVHSSMVAKLGHKRYYRLPVWVREGYAEWITHETDDYLCRFTKELYPYQGYYSQFYNAAQKYNGNVRHLINDLEKAQ